MFSIKNLLKLNPIRSTIIITSCLISSLLTVFVRYNLTWQVDLLKENNIQGFLYLLSLIHISEPTRRTERSRMPSSA